MGSNLCRYWLCLSILMTGCQSMKQMAGLKSKPAANNAASQPSPTTIGSAEATKPADPAKVHLAYAAWHEQTGNYQEAREAYLKVLEKRRKDTEAMLGLARIDRAYGREAEADAQLKKALKYHPKDPKVLVAIGQVHAARHEWPEALEKMQAAHNLAPYDTIYEYHLAVVEARMGEITQSIEHFTRSVGKAEAHFNIAVILNEKGDKSEAESHLIQALKLKPELKQAQAALASIRSGNSDVQPASYSKNDRTQMLP